MADILGKMNDGGPFFTYPLMLFLILEIALFIAAFLRSNEQGKIQKVMVHLGWFAVAWGFLGRTFGLIMAFDMVAAAGELTPSLLAGGLKMALVNPLFGIFIFLLARLFLIILTVLEKKKVA